MIDLSHIEKIYDSPSGPVRAIKDISLHINRGEIYGIIGLSGAGKSTLVRCINLLERPTSGKVTVDGQDITAMSESQLRQARKSIGMIFQHFNLLSSATVYENVAFPLRLVNTPKEKIDKKVTELLELVGLADKANQYPSQLSGGQKQRVAIARALATDPAILLCDEATSALDPQTTESILNLLKEINEKMGITIVIITHQMAVIQKICNRVAIIENGHLVENGLVSDIFAHPRSRAARELILRDAHGTVPTSAAQVDEIRTGQKIRIVFTANSSFEPVIANMILQFGHPVNILLANTRDVGGVAKGEMILQLPDDRDLRFRMEDYLKERGLELEEVDD